MTRLEVECKYSKLYALSKNIRQKSKFYLHDDDISSEELYERVVNDVCNPSIPIDIMLSDEMTDDVIRKYYYRIIRKGDYFTLEIARKIVESYHFRRDKEERMIYALEFVNESRGIVKAKHKLFGPDLDDFKRSLKDLDKFLSIRLQYQEAGTSSIFLTFSVRTTTRLMRNSSYP